MSENMFDESFNIREALDDVIERVALREKLIQTAKQFAEKKREEKFTMAIRQFENLMADYLRLQQPVLERLRNYRESLQKEIQSLRASQATVNGMLEVSRGIEGLAARSQQLESDGQQMDLKLKDRAKTADKIDDLFNRIRPHQSGGTSMPQGRDPLADVLAGMPKDLFTDSSDMGKETTRKTGGRS